MTGGGAGGGGAAPRLGTVPAISRDDVAHLARLARIDLTDAELDHLAPQLAVIVESVAKVSEVAGDDVPPTSHPLPLTNVFRDDVVAPASTAERGAGRRARGRPAAVQRAADPGGGGSERRRSVTSIDPAHRPSWPTRSRAGEVSSVEVDPGPPGPHRGGRRRGARVPARRRRRRAGRRRRGRPPPRGRRGAARAGRRADRRQGRRRDPRAADDRGLADARGLGAAVRRHRRRAAARRRAADPRQDQHGRVRDGLVDRALGLRPDATTRGTSTASPADPAAARRRRSRPSRRRSRSAPTPVARSGSPAAVTGTVGVKPTYGGVVRYGLVALASSLDQAGPVTRTVLDAALLHEVIGGHDPLDSTSIDAPMPAVVEAARQADVRGHAGRRGARAGRRGLPARRTHPVRRGGRRC